MRVRWPFVSLIRNIDYKMTILKQAQSQPHRVLYCSEQIYDSERDTRGDRENIRFHFGWARSFNKGRIRRRLLLSLNVSPVRHARRTQALKDADRSFRPFFLFHSNPFAPTRPQSNARREMLVARVKNNHGTCCNNQRHYLWTFKNRVGFL